MGDPKRPRKRYTTPRHPWQKERIKDENKLMAEYGLKNKREVWKHYTQLRNYRQRARQLAAVGETEQANLLRKELFAKLTRMGVMDKKDPTLDDVLTLEINDFLERRLQTIVFRKGMAHTPNQSRQFIVHGHISLKNGRVTAPSDIVDKSQENEISFRGNSILAKPHPAVPKVTSALDELKQDIATAKGETSEQPKNEEPKEETVTGQPKPEETPAEALSVEPKPEVTTNAA